MIIDFLPRDFHTFGPIKNERWRTSDAFSDDEMKDVTRRLVLANRTSFSHNIFTNSYSDTKSIETRSLIMWRNWLLCAPFDGIAFSPKIVLLFSLSLNVSYFLIDPRRYKHFKLEKNCIVSI